MRDGHANIDVNITNGHYIHAYFFVFYWFRIFRVSWA